VSGVVSGDRSCCSSTADRVCPTCVGHIEALWSVRDDLIRYLRRRGASTELAEDSISETYAVAWRRLAQVPVNHGAARAWLFTVARHVMANLRRRQAHQDSLVRHASLAASTVERTPPSTRLEACEALASLSDEDRHILCLMSVNELSMVELAECLGCSPTAASSRLWRARSRVVQAVAAPDCNE